MAKLEEMARKGATVKYETGGATLRLTETVSSLSQVTSSTSSHLAATNQHNQTCLISPVQRGKDSCNCPLLVQQVY